MGTTVAKCLFVLKPIRFGFKQWVLWSSTGYPFHMDVCTGKTGSSKDITVPLVYRNFEGNAEMCGPQCRVVFMDNFTSHGLADLRTLGFRTTGTVREVHLRCSSEEMKEIDEYERGSYDHKCDLKVLSVKWKDNKGVCLASNYDSPSQDSSKKIQLESKETYPSNTAFSDKEI
jgi:hypothetical protein